MNVFPFPGYSYRRYSYYPRYQRREPPIYNRIPNEPPKLQENINNQTQKKSSKYSPFAFNFDGFTSNDEAIVTLYGIKLYLDDLIILGLLYILYKEEVTDEMLFISLLLLLLS